MAASLDLACSKHLVSSWGAGEKNEWKKGVVLHIPHVLVLTLFPFYLPPQTESLEKDTLDPAQFHLFLCN